MTVDIYLYTDTEKSDPYVHKSFFIIKDWKNFCIFLLIFDASWPNIWIMWKQFFYIFNVFKTYKVFSLKDNTYYCVELFGLHKNKFTFRMYGIYDNTEVSVENKILQNNLYCPNDL